MALADDYSCYHTIPYVDAHHLPNMIRDYLKGEFVEDVYSQKPSIESLIHLAKHKSEHFPHRTTLVSALQRQYHKINTEYCDDEFVQANINAFASASTVCITTGHQACLGGGPLYSFYKIISAIVTCKHLEKVDSSRRYIPVFWMATEDHDWDEANHFFIGDELWKRDITSSGAVGRLSNEGMSAWLDAFASALPKGEVSQDILRLLRNAYLNHDTWAEATRQWAHNLFGAHGLVVIDGDDVELKKLFLPVMEGECFHQYAQTDVEINNERLSNAGYSTQVHPSSINLFYLGENTRSYVKRVDNGFSIDDQILTDVAFREHLHQYPERFSPNVVLRPVYQECILPNIAYYGGPGELAYWFQLSSVFRRWEIPFPMLLLRHGFAMLTTKMLSKIDRLNLSFLDQPAKHWKSMWVEKHSPLRLQLDKERKLLEDIFNELEQMAGRTDKSMQGAVQAQKAKQFKGISNLEKKLLRAEKRKHSETMMLIEELEKHLFPNGIPQERHDSLWYWWLQWGTNPIEVLMDIAQEDVPASKFAFVAKNH
jgi:bacillithiol synthase